MTLTVQALLYYNKVENIAVRAVKESFKKLKEA